MPEPDKTAGDLARFNIPPDDRSECNSLGQLVKKLESSERCFIENIKEYERQKERHGANAAYASQIQAHALLFRADPSRMPGVDRIEALINEDYGTNLTAESVRKLRGKICRRLNCGTEQANGLTMHQAADVLAAEERSSPLGSSNPEPRLGTTPMDLLLTWSGTASHGIATFFRDWLPLVVPGIQPWISSQDIAKGRKWAEELTAQMDKTYTSITFITPDNVRSPWIFFEIGFIAAKLANGTICPYLIEVDGKLVKDSPIGQYQWTESKKDDTLRLIQSINQQLGTEGHNPKLISGNFNSHWGKLKKQLDKLFTSSTPITHDVIQTEPTIEERLSEEARQLLIEGAKDQFGTILFVNNLSGKSLTTNGKSMISSPSARANSMWKAILEELANFSLIEDKNYQGEVFGITHDGYRMADILMTRN